MRQYDELALEKENFPPGAVRVERDPAYKSKTDRVKYIFYDERNRRMCSAKKASWRPEAPEYCATTRVLPNGRCRMHGGTSRVGNMHPNFKTGRYSSELPVRLAARYEESLNDSEMLSLKSEIALVDARLQELLSNVDEGGATPIFKEIADCWKVYNAAVRSKDTGRIYEAQTNLDAAVKAGKSESSTWAEIDRLLETRRRLAISEAKLTLTLGAAVPIEKVNIMIGYILALVNARVSNREEARNLTYDILKLTGRSGVGTDVPRSGDERQLLPAGTPGNDGDE